MQMPRVPQSTLKPEPDLPPQTIVVDVIDGSTDRPVPGVEITLDITERSVSKGDSKSQRRAKADGSGSATFAKLELPAVTEYRASVVREGATFAGPSFQLAQTKAMRAIIYVFPVTRALRDATVLMRGFTYAEILDEAIQINQAYRIINLGTNAWFADNVQVQLPAGAKAFKGGPGDVLWTVAGETASLRGTITPGQHDVSFQYQIPWDGERELSLEFGILPQVQSYRIASDAPPGLQLSGNGFSEAEPTENNSGQRMLIAERSLNRPDPSFRTVTMRLANLPIRPVGRWYAVGIAGVAILGGFYAAGRLRSARSRVSGLTEDERVELEEAKGRLLEELASLDRAHKAGDIGPKTYERMRRNLTDALAHLLSRLEGTSTEGAPYRAKAERGAGLKQPKAEPVELSPTLGETPGGNPGGYAWGQFWPAAPGGIFTVVPPIAPPVFHGVGGCQRVEL
jgi:hypothetical protein